MAFAEVLGDERGLTAAEFWVRAHSWFAHHGVSIERVLTDNGSCYRSKTFRQTCKALSLRHIFTRPYTPKTNGKAECFIQPALREWGLRMVVVARTIERIGDRAVDVGEQTAYLLTAWKLGRYYRTYPAYVEDEVTASLRDPQDFRRGPYTLSRRWTATDDSPAFVVRDGNYLSARWPGDSYRFARTLVGMLAGSAP